MRKIVIITGLTGSGKSGLGVKIAREYNGEIISADSVQIYRGLDIGSAKEDKSTMQEIPHHLIDIKDFSDSYNVGEFIEDAQKAINQVISKNKPSGAQSKKPEPEKAKEETIKEAIAVADSEEVSEETLAVITAALMAYYEMNNPKCEFTIKRIKRLNRI